MSPLTNSTMENQGILFDTKNGLITIKGVYITENPKELFKDLNNQIDDYLTNPTVNLTLDFKIEYLNTNMSLIIRNLIKKLHETVSETNFKVRWFFEIDDEDMEDMGEEFKLLFDNLDYELIGVERF